MLHHIQHNIVGGGPVLGEQRSLDMNGVDEAADSDSTISTVLGQLDSFSFSVWVRPNAAWGSFSDCALLAEPPTGANGPHSFSNGTSLYITVNTFNNASNAKAAIPTSGAWNHITGSYDRNNGELQKLYVNGVTTNSGTNSDGAIINGSKLWAWGRSLVTGNFIQQKVCQIAIWSSQLSNANHIALYGGGSIVEANTIEPGNLVQWNRIDENDNLAVANGIIDHSGNGNTISGVNMTNGANLSTDVP